MDGRDFDGMRGYYERLLAASGHPISRDTRILDFGCGKGELVRAFSDAGYTNVYGCDFPAEVVDDEQLRVIEQPYRLPFDDAAFDCVVSAEVFEHVQDYQQALAEIRRVLAPSGVSLHLFPSPYRLKEPHVFVPLATVLRWQPWLLLWAKLGIRNEFQQGLPAREVAWLNHQYLRDHTTYYSRRETLRQAQVVFSQARLLEMERLADRSKLRGRLVDAVAHRFPTLATLYSETHERALLLPG